jgi:Trk-type K+ transport system membrane component
MTHNDFTYSELLKFGWEKTREHLWFLVGIAFLYIVLTGISSHSGVSILVSMVLTIATVGLSLHITSGHAPKYEDLLTPFKTYHVAVHYVIASILYMLGVIVGLLLLILPGIYFAVQFQFYSYIIVEHKDMKPVDALKKSFAITKGHFWKIFGFTFITVIVNLLGLLALGVGLLITLPVTAIAYARLYRKLADHHAGLAKTI